MGKPLLAAVVLLSVVGCDRKKPAPAPPIAAAAASGAAPVAVPEDKPNDGTDPKAPVFSPLPVTIFRSDAIVEQLAFAKVKADYTDLDFTTLYRADIDNDGHPDFVLTERNSVGLHNDTIIGVYSSAPTSGVRVDVTKPIPKEGPLGHGYVIYLADPFLRAEAEGITMTFLEGPHYKPARYLWKGAHISAL